MSSFLATSYILTSGLPDAMTATHDGQPAAKQSGNSRYKITRIENLYLAYMYTVVIIKHIFVARGPGVECTKHSIVANRMTV